MRELTSASSPVEWRIDTASGARLVTLRDEGGLSFRSVCGGAGEAVVVAANRHRADGGDDTLYLTVGPDGVEEITVEHEGVNPALYTGPDGNPWARMSVLQDGVDQEPDTLLPLRGRGRWEQPPRTSAFAGDFVGWIGDRAFWHLDDVFDERRPSRVQAADLESGAGGPRWRVRRPVRLPLPQSQYAVVCTDGAQLAVLALDADPAGPATLRILTPDTLAVERERPVLRDPEEAFLLLAEAHSDGSALLYSVADDGRVSAVRLDGTGARSTAPAGVLPDGPFAVWPVHGPGHHALRFTTEHTNGLLVLDGAIPVALWAGAPDRYRDSVTGRETRLGADWGLPVLVGAAASGRSHALLLRPEDDRTRLAVLFG
ncbi:hypothetical protein ACFV6D_30350 [Kitasatospora sp. NPDC059812]|uniref:hypothetical protein n=1 Tax=Kitasatospora sp. NPDC059812 TaxID=3346958 RepID=UPI00366264DA